MISKVKIKNQLRQSRRKRVRSKVVGTAKIPRLCVSRSLRYVKVQIIDDQSGKTIVFASDEKLKGKKVERAKETGKLIAKLAKEKNINKVVFDRAGNKYHGRIKSVADGAREGGLEF